MAKDSCVSPYRAFDTCETYKGFHGSPIVPKVWRYETWRWGPFAAGTIVWGDETYRVWATPWFSLWFLRRKKGITPTPKRVADQ